MRGEKFGILSTRRRKKVHLSQDLRETISSKYSDGIAGEKLLIFHASESTFYQCPTWTGSRSILEVPAGLRLA